MEEKDDMQKTITFIIIIALLTAIIVIWWPNDYTDNATNEILNETKQVKEGITDDDKKRYIEQLVSDSIEYERYTNEYFMNFAYANDNTKITDAISKLDYSARCPYAFVRESPRAQAIETHIQKKCEIIRNYVMPAYRKRYAKNLDTAMWEYNMDVYASSTRYKWLNLTGYMFADNGTIKEYYELMKYKAKSLGYTRICFRWYEGQDEYQYFTID